MEISREDFPNCHEGLEYAKAVAVGDIPASKYVIGACARFLRDLKDPRYIFYPEKAEKFLRIVQKFEHVVGVWDTPNIIYSPWQKWLWMNIVGLYSLATGFRKYRTAHIEIPRGNSKSTMSSQAALFFLACEGESQGNHVSCLATRREQARIVLDAAREMGRKNKSFLKAKKVQVLAHKIVQKDTFSHIVAKSSDSTGLDGLTDKIAICDELHAMKRETYEVIDSGMSKRRDSLLLCITTAGSDLESVGYSQSVYAKKIALGEFEDETFFSAVYTLDEEDDPYDPLSWQKANPNWGFSVDPVNFEAKARKAQANPQDAANFKIKHLNMWQSEARAFFDLSKWDACARPEMKIEDFRGKRCYAAIDLSSKIDLTALAFVFKTREGEGESAIDYYDIFDFPYLPEERAKEVKSALYDQAIAESFLTATPGEAIHYPKLREDFLRIAKTLRVLGVHYDPWNATEFSQQLTKERLEMVEFRMNTSNLSEPTKQLDALIRQGRIRHRGSPLFRWNMGNVVCKEDANGNVFPRKSHDKLKIDISVAAIMALAGWIQEEQNESVYRSRGIRII